MKRWQDWHKEEAGFTLLELIMVVAVIAVLATALSGTIVTQYEMWQLNTNQAKVFEHSELLVSYLEKDIAQAIDYEVISETELELDLDKNHDGAVDETITYSESNIDQYSKLVRKINFSETKNRLIKADIVLESGDFEKEITKYFHIGPVNYTTN